MCSVTAEAAGSSPVVPAIPLNGLRTYRTCWLIHNQSTEPVLRTDFVVVIALGVKVKRSLHFRMPPHLLHGLRINLPLIHQPIAEAVAQVVKSEAVSFWDSYASRDSSFPQVGPVEHRRADWD